MTAATAGSGGRGGGGWAGSAGGRIAVLLAAVAMAALTFRLGLWQLDRAAQKTALAQAIATRGALPPLATGELAGDAQAAALQHHRRAVLEGAWRPGATVFLDNRQMHGRPGFFVLTPLVLADGSAVVVQRGWVPRSFTDRAQVAAPPLPAGTVRVEGRIAPAPSRLYDFEGAPTGPIRQNVDLDALARETGLALRPLSLLQLGPAGDGLLRDWPQPDAGVAKHHGYAVQWFAMSALVTGLYVWFQLIRPRRQRA